MAKKEERQKQILSALGAKDELDVDELAGMFSLTAATIRRDLTELDRQGRLTKVHGELPCRTAAFWQTSLPWRLRRRWR